MGMPVKRKPPAVTAAASQNDDRTPRMGSFSAFVCVQPFDLPARDIVRSAKTAHLGEHSANSVHSIRGKFIHLRFVTGELPTQFVQEYLASPVVTQRAKAVTTANCTAVVDAPSSLSGYDISSIVDKALRDPEPEQVVFGDPLFSADAPVVKAAAVEQRKKPSAKPPKAEPEPEPVSSKHVPFSGTVPERIAAVMGDRPMTVLQILKALEDAGQPLSSSNPRNYLQTTLSMAQTSVKTSDGQTTIRYPDGRPVKAQYFKKVDHGVFIVASQADRLAEALKRFSQATETTVEEEAVPPTEPEPVVTKSEILTEPAEQPKQPEDKTLANEEDDLALEQLRNSFEIGDRVQVHQPVNGQYHTREGRIKDKEKRVAVVVMGSKTDKIPYKHLSPVPALSGRRITHVVNSAPANNVKVISGSSELKAVPTAFEKLREVIVTPEQPPVPVPAPEPVTPPTPPDPPTPEPAPEPLPAPIAASKQESIELLSDASENLTQQQRNYLTWLEMGTEYDDKVRAETEVAVRAEAAQMTVQIEQLILKRDAKLKLADKLASMPTVGGT